MLAEPATPDHEIDRNPLPLWLRWNRTSPQLIIESEAKLLQRLKSNLKGFFVPIFGGKCFIRTVVASSAQPHSNGNPEENLPFVLVHGFASGLGLWCKNVDAFAAHRSVYTFDLLGFGRSSRPTFPKEATEVEARWVDSLEQWRSAINLEKFILIGHSLGGYISTAYALRYPQRVSHLILVDPWGFSEIPFDEATMARLSGNGILLRTIRNYFTSSNPLAVLRAIGPLGRSVIHRVREDLRGAFDQRYLLSGEYFEVPSCDEEAKHTFHCTSQSDSEASTDSFRNPSVSNGGSSNKDTSLLSKNSLNLDDLDGSIALDYVYHINVRNPSGEIAFKSLCTRMPWARNPMLHRIDQLDSTVPITFIFGSRSWMDISSGTKTRARRPNSYVGIKIIEGAGHQVYAQAAEEFNACVNEVASLVDSGCVFSPGTEPVDSSPKSSSVAPVVQSSCPDDRVRKKRYPPTSPSLKSRLLCSRSQSSPVQIRRPSRVAVDDANDEAST